MLNENRKRVGIDEEKISVHLSQEINYWTKQLNSNPERLRKAVETVGPIVKDVRKWLSLNQK